MPLLLQPFNFFHRWDELHMEPALELLETFARGVESDAALSIKQYQESTEEGYEIDYGDQPQFVRVYDGIESQSWDLDDLFVNYYPSLRRSSSFLTIHGFVEHELQNLCECLQSYRELKVAPSDLRRQGIEGATDYLEKVTQIDVCRGSREWESLANLIKLRNCLIHSAGKPGKRKDGLLKYIEDSHDLSLNGSTIHMKEGFLLGALATYKSYAKCLGASLRKEIA